MITWMTMPTKVLSKHLRYIMLLIIVVSTFSFLLNCKWLYTHYHSSAVTKRATTITRASQKEVDLQQPATRQGTGSPPYQIDFQDYNLQPVHRQYILLTYGRSGSTFTGDLLSLDPRVFYTYEPLQRALIRNTGSDQLQSFDVLKGTKFAPPSPRRSPSVSTRNSTTNSTATSTTSHHAGISNGFLEPYFSIFKEPTYANFSVELSQVLRHMLTCQFEKVKVDDMMGKMLKNRRSTQAFHTCAREMVTQNSEYSKYHYLGCLWKLKKQCMSREIRSSKVIRFPAKLLYPLMSEFPHLKVLYLVRDPRATLISERHVLGSYKRLPIRAAATQFCSMVLEDAGHVKKLSDMYPDRVKTIRYETLARDPMAVSQRLFRFLELNFTPEVQRWIYSKTHASKENGPFSTERKNAWLSGNIWRKTTSAENVLAIDGACAKVLDTLGYVRMTDTGVDDRKSEADVRTILQEPKQEQKQMMSFLSMFRNLNVSLAHNVSSMENV